MIYVKYGFVGSLPMIKHTRLGVSPSSLAAFAWPEEGENMTPDQHPTISLFYALNALNITLGNTNSFRRLVEEREMHDEQVRKIRDFSLSVLNAEKKHHGISLEEILGSVHKKLIEPGESSYSYENEAMIDSLKSVLASGEEIVDSALNALRTGGGDALDAAFNPGAFNQTIHLRTKLDEAQSLFGVIKTTLAMPNVLQGLNVQKMSSLASWFQQKTRELGAIVEQHGIEKMAPTSTNGNDLRPARWFTKATKGILTGDILRKAVGRQALVKSVQLKKGSEWSHSVGEVCSEYSQYVPKIREALDKEQL